MIQVCWTDEHLHWLDIIIDSPDTMRRRLAIFISTVNLLLQMNWFESYQSLTSYTEHWRMTKFDFSPRPPLNLKTCVWILISWTIRYNHHREKPASYETESTVRYWTRKLFIYWSNNVRQHKRTKQQILTARKSKCVVKPCSCWIDLLDYWLPV